MDGRLTEYRRRRDFTRTAEPEGSEDTGKSHRRGREAALPMFVVHKHDASSLHYDLRLEVDGVLKSWAVPKGPSVDPADKRLALPTEDHPLEYGDFEGVIPEGEYGAGTVLVWDTGTYEHNPNGDQPDGPAAALQEGRLEVWLHGEKLRGGYVLTRMRGRGGDRWLLVKKDDQGADRRRQPTTTQPQSVLSGGDLDEVAQQGTQPR